MLYPYAMANQSNSVLLRFNYGPHDQIIRYPDDPYDRIWRSYPYNLSEWREISTSNTIQRYKDDYFQPPIAVLQKAVTPIRSRQLIAVQWSAEQGISADLPPPDYFAVLHFTELEILPENASRQFNVYYSGRLWRSSVDPRYLMGYNVYSTEALDRVDPCVFTLESVNNSTLPPIINAVEIYSILDLPNPMTQIDDVHAIVDIKEEYGVKKNWMGDPCTPNQYAWDGVTCNYNSSPPRITSLNLSFSGLTGSIYSSFSRLQATTYLDLSYNNLTGEIPGFLATMPSLKILTLTGNHLTGTVPLVLREKQTAGLIILNIDDNSNLCANGNTCKKKRNIELIIAISIIVPVALLLLLTFIIWRIRKSGSSSGNNLGEQHNENGSDMLMDGRGNAFQIDCQQFTYTDLQRITNKFEHEIGKGGFGTVYHGLLYTGVQVAVKVLSSSSLQGTKEFLAEVQHLSRVHHRNLLSLVGYCKEGAHLALVYDYMPGGSLQGYIRGKVGVTRVLSWEERLRILLEASQGLEYLHRACDPPIIHRDVKTGNILLNQNLEAKISDFGLSKTFRNGSDTHISTAVAGTPGYLDPEYNSTYQLNEKSDVYSFGVVLLEVITGQPPVLASRENIHIRQWVHQRLTNGGIDDVADSKLLDQYNVNSAWKIVELSMSCTARTSLERPTMAFVVSQLKESLELASVSAGSSQASAFQVPHTGDSFLTDGPSAR